MEKTFERLARPKPKPEVEKDPNETFKPIINQTYFDQQQLEDFSLRNQLWQQNKQEKIRQR